MFYGLFSLLFGKDREKEGNEGQHAAKGPWLESKLEEGLSLAHGVGTPPSHLHSSATNFI